MGKLPRLPRWLLLDVQSCPALLYSRAFTTPQTDLQPIPTYSTTYPVLLGGSNNLINRGHPEIHPGHRFARQLIVRLASNSIPSIPNCLVVLLLKPGFLTWPLDHDC
ncbi:hypothetical protein HYQ45_005864 [Verticillium longisporum]|uniref:Uncharacterized protein n=1 Tax=Verticillium longisporum TaxID=100787 RepID=A0A8I2ZQU8_VERLO|nr:hypothetical protein HYQ45_005864 [Verticillium longisporum]